MLRFATQIYMHLKAYSICLYLSSIMLESEEWHSLIV